MFKGLINTTKAIFSSKVTKFEKEHSIERLEFELKKCTDNRKQCSEQLVMV